MSLRLGQDEVEERRGAIRCPHCGEEIEAGELTAHAGRILRAARKSAGKGAMPLPTGCGVCGREFPSRTEFRKHAGECARAQKEKRLVEKGEAAAASLEEN